MTCGTPPDDRRGDHVEAPLDSSPRGRRRFTHGAHGLVIRADARLAGLCRARLGERVPIVGVQGGVVTVRYAPSPTEHWLSSRPARPVEVALNARIPWDIEIRSGASRVIADLRELQLGSLRLDGGASRLEVALPAPVGTVGVLLLAGASNVVIRRPAGVDARLRVDGGVTNLTFDGRHVGAAGGGLDLQDDAYDDATDRYDVAVTGGANNVCLGTHHGVRRQGSGALA